MSKTIKLPDFLPSDTRIMYSGIVVNQFSGQKYELTSLERTVYHAILKHEKIAQQMDRKYIETMNPDDANPNAVRHWEIVRNGSAWFKENNAKAYMVLID